MATDRHETSEGSASAWTEDAVTTRGGISIPVRATSRRPRWDDLPAVVRDQIESAAGAKVLDAWSAGSGFTPGFASRLGLADGRQVFVKAASSADDRLHGWELSDAYRAEARKLRALGPGFGAPALLWSRDLELAGDRWVLLGLTYVDGRPPRRPWQPPELRLVLDRLAEIASALADPPSELRLVPVSDDVVAGFDERLARVRALTGPSEWLDTVEELCVESETLLAGSSLVHFDLRDDNVLIGDAGDVWFVDWNFPSLGAPWIDVICILLSARGDGLDVEEIIGVHPLTIDVDPRAIDSLLALLWSYWAIGRTEAVPSHSPHLRDHQAWYADVTEDWLRDRLRAPDSSDRPRALSR